MPTAKPIVRFLVIASCCYALLLALWPVLGGAYSSAFTSIANVAFHTFGSTGTVRFDSLSPMPGEEFDCKLQLRNTRTVAGLSQPISTRLLGYVPTIVTLSLFVATVAADRRRWKALVVALAAIHLFITLRLAIMLLAYFSGDNQVAQFSFGRFADGAIGFLNDLFTRSITTHYLVPVILWLVLITACSRHPAHRDAA